MKFIRLFVFQVITDYTTPPSKEISRDLESRIKPYIRQLTHYIIFFILLYFADLHFVLPSAKVQCPVAMFMAQYPHLLLLRKTWKVFTQRCASLHTEECMWVPNLQMGGACDWIPPMSAACVWVPLYASMHGVQGVFFKVSWFALPRDKHLEPASIPIQPYTFNCLLMTQAPLFL